MGASLARGFGKRVVARMVRIACIVTCVQKAKSKLGKRTKLRLYACWRSKLNPLGMRKGTEQVLFRSSASHDQLIRTIHPIIFWTLVTYICLCSTTLLFGAWILARGQASLTIFMRKAT